MKVKVFLEYLIGRLYLNKTINSVEEKRLMELLREVEENDDNS